MYKIRLTIIALFTLFLTADVFANGGEQQELKDYFSKINQKVKSTDIPVKKREILNNSFDELLKAFHSVKEMPLSANDKKGINYFENKIQQKKYELNGTNGYQKVSDSNLNQFADYSMQQFEQSAEYITISVITLVLIIILVALLL